MIFFFPQIGKDHKTREKIIKIILNDKACETNVPVKRVK